MPKTTLKTGVDSFAPWAIHPAAMLELETRLRAAAENPMQFVQLNKTANISPEERLKIKQEWEKLHVGLSEGRVISAPLVRLRGESDEPKLYRKYGGAAVIPIKGGIGARTTYWSWLFDETSHDDVREATRAALADGSVEAIVYDIDSPGGVVTGMLESADELYAAKKVKPTYGVSNYTAASAAYWYLSQCGEAICAPSGMVGCIGVLMMNTDATEALKKMGIRQDMVSNESSPYKAEGWPQTPVTAEWLAELKRMCDHYGEMFVAAIARGRGIRPATVERDFGKGRMVPASEALAAKMIDRVATLEEVVTKMSGAKSRRAMRAMAADLVNLKLPTK